MEVGLDWIASPRELVIQFSARLIRTNMKCSGKISVQDTLSYLGNMSSMKRLVDILPYTKKKKHASWDGATSHMFMMCHGTACVSQNFYDARMPPPPEQEAMLSCGSSQRFRSNLFI